MNNNLKSDGRDMKLGKQVALTMWEVHISIFPNHQHTTQNDPILAS